MASENADIVMLLEKATKEMRRRSEEFKQRDDYKWGNDYHDYNYKPLVIIFDEVLAFFGGSADQKDQKEAKKHLLDLVIKGRQSGVFVVLTTQRADTEFIKGALRDQLNLRIAFGSMSYDGYAMTFGKENGNIVLNENDLGSGFISIKGVIQKPVEFNSPYISDSYDFIKDIQGILKKNKKEDFKKGNVIPIDKNEKKKVIELD